MAWIVFKIAAGALAGVLFIGAASQAESLRDELQRFLHDDAAATLHIRSYFLDRTNPSPPNDVAWAGGGWVGLKTGWFYDTFQLGAVGCMTQPLWAPTTTDGTNLLAPGQYGLRACLLHQHGGAIDTLRLRSSVYYVPTS